MMLIMTLFFTSFLIDDSYAARVSYAKHDRAFRVADKSVKGRNCTNFSAIAITGKTLYGLKVHTNDNAGVIYKVTNFSKSKKRKMKAMPIKQGGKVISVGHANGMEYYKGTLFLATLNAPGQGAQIIATSTSGRVKKNYYLDKTISSITYFRNGNFILGAGLKKIDGKQCRRYYVAKYVGGKFEIGKTFYVNTCLSGQDIHYRKGKLYIVAFDSKTGGRVKTSYIYRINIKSPVKDEGIYHIRRTIISRSISKRTSLFELEGIDFYGSRIYCSTNVTRKGNGADAVYWIKP